MMRIVFMGTGEIAIPSLQWLMDQQSTCLNLVGVFTQPDRKVGRKQILTAPEIKVIAEKHGVPVFQPERFRNDETALHALKSLDCDIAVVMAYGQILPDEVIATPAVACVNLHASLLPRHRGASPIQAAIREGDTESGITLMHIKAELDAGDIILKKSLPIRAEETGGSLHDRLAGLGPVILEAGLPLLASGTAPREEQDEAQVTVCGKLNREDGEIDWNRSALEIERLIRAYHPWPGTFTFLGDRESGFRKLKIYPGSKVGPDSGETPGRVISGDGQITVACGGGGSLILEGDLQLEGRKRLAQTEFLRGMPVEKGIKLGKK